MTSFWNFVAIGHSPPFVVQKKNFSDLLPGFRLYIMEPAAEQLAEQEAMGTALAQEQEVGDLRYHLTQMFFKYSLPFQKVLINAESSNSAAPKINLIFLKS
mmetsp:Transcript_26405/g.35277  ORF Transcript_26405/g.35277 Transcript_26405/m.35277 type:complete len:101 (+) Transcript_26405:653-955(+)